jgi:hypothetical protein
MVTIDPVASARRNGVYYFWRFHVLGPYRPNMEKSGNIFHVLCPNINLDGKFSMI